jgi:hypothetical protein
MCLKFNETIAAILASLLAWRKFFKPLQFSHSLFWELHNMTRSSAHYYLLFVRKLNWLKFIEWKRSLSLISHSWQHKSISLVHFMCTHKMKSEIAFYTSLKYVINKAIVVIRASLNFFYCNSFLFRTIK